MKKGRTLEKEKDSVQPGWIFTPAGIPRTAKRARRVIPRPIERFGAPIDFSNAGIRPEYIRQKCLSACKLGRRAAHKWQNLNLEETDRRAQTLFLDSFDDDPPWCQIQHATFWLSASMECELLAKTAPEFMKRVAPYGARSQQILTQALSRFSPEEREFVSMIAEDNGRLRMNWQWSCRGAFSVVQTAYLLQEKGLRVILPNIKIDIEYKVDLLAELPEHGARVLGMQIKSSNAPFSTASLLDSESHVTIDSSKAQKGEARLRRKTFEKMSEFAERYGVTCVPSLVAVGKNQLAPWELDPHNYLREALQMLIENCA